MAKDYSSRPSWQYNAIMLMRILAEHPGETFTRNIDAKFVDAARALLKSTKDNNVRQILMDTLEEFERAKFYDTNLTLIISMWQEEKDKAVEKHGVRDDGHFFFHRFVLSSSSIFLRLLLFLSFGSSCFGYGFFPCHFSSSYPLSVSLVQPTLAPFIPGNVDSFADMKKKPRTEHLHCLCVPHSPWRLIFPATDSRKITSLGTTTTTDCRSPLSWSAGCRRRASLQNCWNSLS